MRRPTGIMRIKMYGKLQECFYCFMIPLNMTPMLLIHTCCYTGFDQSFGRCKRLLQTAIQATVRGGHWCHCVSKENRNPVCILIYIFEGYFKKDMPTDLIFYFFIEYF